jgi:SAM-dependent methyltransferase
MSPRYDQIGDGYARTRREDPRIARVIEAALGDARTVVSVGAGAGSYEPRDRHVIAIEPSDVMAAQRRPDLVPAIRAGAGELPLRDRSVDAAMAVLTVHHWDADQGRGVRELRRVARETVVILTYDPVVSGQMWLMNEYLPEVADLDRRMFPCPQRIAVWLGGSVEIATVLLPRDCRDWMPGSFWSAPERVLDPSARSATSGFARMPPEVIARVSAAVRRDLASGAWDRRHGHLRTLDQFDVGLRLITATR